MFEAWNKGDAAGERAQRAAAMQDLPDPSTEASYYRVWQLKSVRVRPARARLHSLTHRRAGVGADGGGGGDARVARRRARAAGGGRARSGGASLPACHPGREAPGKGAHLLLRFLPHLTPPAPFPAVAPRSRRNHGHQTPRNSAYLSSRLFLLLPLGEDVLAAVAPCSLRIILGVKEPHNSARSYRIARPPLGFATSGLPAHRLQFSPADNLIETMSVHMLI